MALLIHFRKHALFKRTLGLARVEVWWEGDWGTGQGRANLVSRRLAHRLSICVCASVKTIKVISEMRVGYYGHREQRSSLIYLFDAYFFGCATTTTDKVEIELQKQV